MSSRANLALASVRKQQSEPGAIFAVEELLRCNALASSIAGVSRAGRPAHCMTRMARSHRRAGVRESMDWFPPLGRIADVTTRMRSTRPGGGEVLRGCAALRACPAITWDHRRFGRPGPNMAMSGPNQRCRLSHRQKRDPGFIGLSGAWRDPDSNRGHHDFQSCALPTELSRRGPEG